MGYLIKFVLLRYCVTVIIWLFILVVLDSVNIAIDCKCFMCLLFIKMVTSMYVKKLVEETLMCYKVLPLINKCLFPFK